MGVVLVAVGDTLVDDLERLAHIGALLALKTYRVDLDSRLPVPVLPCLDHEALLHQHVPPHVSAYLQPTGSTDIHEVALYGQSRVIQVDTVSTVGEFSVKGHDALVSQLRALFPGYRVSVTAPTWWRGERRVAEACRAQITLRDVLTGGDAERLRRQIERLQMVSSLMEKQSRVASWGVRTMTGPLLAAVGVMLYSVLGMAAPRLGPTAVEQIRYAVVAMLGGTFLYYGLKAVQLTDMANRVWKRASEYSLILAERRRLTPM